MLNLDTSVGMLDLTTRAYNVLMRNGIETLGDILIAPINVLGTLSGMGQKTYDEIINKIHSLGYISVYEDSSKVTKDVYDSILEYKEKIDNANEIKNKEIENIKSKYRFLLYTILDYKIESLNLPINLFYYLKNININYIGDILKMESLELKKEFNEKKDYETLLAFLHYNGLLLIDENIENDDIEALNEFINNLAIKKITDEDDRTNEIYNTLKEIHTCKEVLYRMLESLNALNNKVASDYKRSLERKKQTNEE